MADDGPWKGRKCCDPLSAAGRRRRCRRLRSTETTALLPSNQEAQRLVRRVSYKISVLPATARQSLLRECFTRSPSGSRAPSSSSYASTESSIASLLPFSAEVAPFRFCQRIKWFITNIAPVGMDRPLASPGTSFLSPPSRPSPPSQRRIFTCQRQSVFPSSVKIFILWSLFLLPMVRRNAVILQSEFICLLFLILRVFDILSASGSQLSTTNHERGAVLVSRSSSRISNS